MPITKKICDMNKFEIGLVKRFKMQHEITTLIGSATFFWNAQEQKWQIIEYTPMPYPFEAFFGER